MRTQFMPRRPRLTYLRAFDASARYLSFSLAAQELNLTQAAVSQQIKLLETALGASLFLRHNRSLTLSESGTAYYHVVREVLDRLDSVTDQLFPDTGKTIVTVHCTPSIATIWLAPRMRDFHALHPNIEVHLRTTDILPDKYRGQSNDLEIVRQSRDAEPDEAMSKLWDVQILPVCSPDYLAGRGPVRSADRICELDLIHTLGYENDWHRWARLYASPKVEVKSGFSVDGLVISIEAACRGEGVILGRKPLIDDYLQDGRLVEALPGNPGLTTAYFIKIAARAPGRRPIKLLADWIVDQAHQE
ncbi:LysR substrate-binding domain-containing protein [Litoreibacter halocynthiae]|nr:LysR substrate-binding domain-containing protein [Litoreibacter halocynthiae]